MLKALSKKKGMWIGVPNKKGMVIKLLYLNHVWQTVIVIKKSGGVGVSIYIKKMNGPNRFKIILAFGARAKPFMVEERDNL